MLAMMIDVSIVDKRGLSIVRSWKHSPAIVPPCNAHTRASGMRRATKRQLHSMPSSTRFRRSAVSPADNRALAACARFGGDVLIVESELDDIIRQAVIKNYKNACAQARSLTARVISAANHSLSDPDMQRAYTKLLIGWITEMIVGARKNLGNVPAAA